MTVGMLAPHTAPGRRWARRSGYALVVVGLVLLGYVAWQVWGTTWVSHRTQERIRAEVEDGWADGRASVQVDASGDRLPAGAIVHIPRFGDDYAVPVVEGTSEAALASGLAHDQDSGAAGEPGNYVLAGHRVTHGQPLRDMPDLRAGDEVVVETRDAVYTYVLDMAGDALEVNFSDTWVTDPLPTNPDGGVQPAQEPGATLITLVTCAELFHSDDRLVAFGHLASRRPR